MATKTVDALHPRFHFIGGKGGVGKTTCAAAAAISAAAAGVRVLVASTDPAPSLGDALKAPLSGRPRVVPTPRGRLHAVEIDADQSLAAWLDERREVMESIALQGTWLDREDVERLLRLSLPGIDELAALLEIDRISRSGRYDLVVVDTAPTGHTLRMLSMPETLMGVARVFDRMREKQRVIQEALRGDWRSGPEDRLIDELGHTSQRLHTMLRDGSRTRVDWVTLAEPLAVSETCDAVAALEEAGIEVKTIVVNRLTPPPPTRCRHCDGRRAHETEAIRSLGDARRVVRIMDRDGEPRGVRPLRTLGAELEAPASTEVRTTPRAGRWQATLTGRRTSVEHLFAESTRLVLLGGKGGVGKTTCAATLALAAGRRVRDRRVLLVSTDPAHSLSDVLAQPIGHHPTLITGAAGNVHARELDAGKVLALLQQQYADAIDGMFDRLRGQSAFDASHDRAVMRTLIDLAPPGLDELAAVLETTDALGADPPAWDLIVMDTAPTGHALRLLEMPALVHDWTHALMTILLKYQGVTPLGTIGAMLVRLSKGIRALRELLADPRRTAFIAVTRPATLPRLETVRLLQRLDELGIPAPAVIVNAVGRGTCARCTKIAAAQQREITALTRALTRRSKRRFAAAPTEVPAPQKPAAVARWSGAWRDIATVGPKTSALSSTR